MTTTCPPGCGSLMTRASHKGHGHGLRVRRLTGSPGAWLAANGLLHRPGDGCDHRDGWTGRALAEEAAGRLLHPC